MRLPPSRTICVRALFTALFFALLFASSAAAETQAISPKVLAALESPSVRVRVTAVVAISKSKDPNARRILEGMLADPSVPVRAAAVEGLERLGDPRAVLALEKMRQDKAPLVRKVAARALEVLKEKAKGGGPSAASSEQKAALTLQLGPAKDYSGRAPEGATARLRSLVSYALRNDGRRPLRVEPAGVGKGYQLLVAIRSITPFTQGAVNGLNVRCELTVVELPSNALRLSLNATAGVGVEGALDAATERELITEAVDACAPALAKDFADWAQGR